jgi:hypothetical protein
MIMLLARENAAGESSSREQPEGEVSEQAPTSSSQ